MNESAEITIKELSDMAVGSYLLADVRDEISFGYGAIPGAVSMPNIVELAKEGTLAKDKKYILYCMKGVASADAAIELRELDYDAVSLAGGYSAWLMASFGGDDKQEDIEKSLRKGRFHKALFSKFAKAINTYDLIQPGDKIAVCISGGKDSMLMAKLFQELKRHNKFPLSLFSLSWIRVTVRLIESSLKIMHGSWGCRLLFLNLRFLRQCTISKNLHVIFVQECVAVICTTRQKNWGVIKLHWVITMMMLLKLF